VWDTGYYSLTIYLIHRLYGQLEEVKQKRAYKAREAQKVDVQARRKEYGSKLLARSKKSS
jgi:hypothetical protein